MFSIINKLKNDFNPAPRNGLNALVLISGAVNYYYDNIGLRIAEALRTLGFEVDVCTLRQVTDRDYDWGFINPVYEVTYPYGNKEEALERVKTIVSRCHHSANILLECVKTQWFATSWEPFRYTGIETLFDLGLHSQLADIPPGMEVGYWFAYNGLTGRERRIAQQWLDHPGERPIPWTFVGHLEPVRIEFIRQVLSQMDPQGFIYMPQLTHITADGPHMNEKHMQDVLEKTRYFLWRTHHDYFYMESERFRSAMLAGAVPLKIMDTDLIGEREVPFRNMLIDEENFGEIINTLPFEQTREMFLTEFMALPSVEQELHKLILERSGVHV